MARHKDSDWNLPHPQVETWEQAQIAVLMDIRDELKRINALLYCPNFIEVPSRLRIIQLNTTKSKRKARTIK